LLGQPNGKVDNWSNIIQWLHNAGYKNQGNNQAKITDYLSLDIVIKECDINVNKCSLNMKNNHLLIDLNIRLSSPLSEDNFNSAKTKEKKLIIITIIPPI
jgi:hypothetical protein